MFNELPIKTPFCDFSAFLEDGFYVNTKASNHHNHNYTEVHILTGECTMTASGESFSLSGTSMIAIPPGVYHATLASSESVKHTAFQISRDIDRVKLFSVNEALASELFDRISAISPTDDHADIPLYLAFFSGMLFSDGGAVPRPVADTDFLIHEFISLNYHRDARLCELAELLHLSERQAERLVLARYGIPFRKALAGARIDVAKQLIENSDMTLAEIAVSVGYRSYAGFWKAFKAENEAKHK